MKKVFLAAPLLLLVGCTTKEVVYMPATTVVETTVETTVVETTAAPTTQPAPPTTKAISKSDKEFIYLMTVKDGTTLDLFFDDAFIIEFGYLTCDFFAAGGTSDELFELLYQVAYENGLGSDIVVEFGGASGAAVGALCPQYDYLIG